MSSNLKSVNVLGIAATFVGTVIGAGYASGQEILQYFVYFGPWGIGAILIAGVLFFLTGYFAMALGRKLQTSDYQHVVNPLKNPIPQYFCDIMILFSLVGTFVIMIAGNAANFQRQFGLPLAVGGIFLVVLCVINLLFGMRGLVLIQSLIVPIMVVVAIGVSLYAIANPISAAATEYEVNSSPMIKNWIMSGILYVSFNAQLAIAVLVPIGHEGRMKRSTLFWGTFIGGFLLGLGALVEYFALIRNASIIGTTTLPMVELAANISPIMQGVYTLVLFFGLYSTAISCFFGTYERFADIPALERFGKVPLLIGIAVICFIASFVGFKDLVGYVYPALGYGGMIIMVLMSWMYFKKVGTTGSINPDPGTLQQAADTPAPDEV